MQSVIIKQVWIRLIRFTFLTIRAFLVNPLSFIPSTEFSD